jgi:hypothetical protein
MIAHLQSLKESLAPKSCKVGYFFDLHVVSWCRDVKSLSQASQLHLGYITGKIVRYKSYVSYVESLQILYRIPMQILYRKWDTWN